MAHLLHETVRRRFAFQCAYCGTTETEAGGELTVDHYHPLSANGPDLLENLIYACFRCNVYKGDYWAAPPIINRILNPLQDDFSQHFYEDTVSGGLVSLTETGGFHIHRLNLNRPQLNTRRLQRRLNDMMQVREENLRTEIERLREIIQLQEKLLRQYRSDWNENNS